MAALSQKQMVVMRVLERQHSVARTMTSRIPLHRPLPTSTTIRSHRASRPVHTSRPPLSFHFMTNLLPPCVFMTHGSSFTKTNVFNAGVGATAQCGKLENDDLSDTSSPGLSTLPENRAVYCLVLALLAHIFSDIVEHTAPFRGGRQKL